jgi:outer membrane receptor for ferrienterochelin and colicin
MKTRINIIFILFLLIAFPLTAQVNGIVVDENNEPLVGVNVYWADTQTGTSTDVDGKFEIVKVPENQQLVISYVGYQNDTLTVTENQLQVQLKKGIELNEVNVTAQNLRTTNSRIMTIQTQQINYGELCRAACCNLGESFETNPSVDVSYSDAATGSKQIKLLGLSGSYVQMLTEKIPNFRGLAVPYGLGYVPGSWIESIQISKGTSSVVDGYESITGQINVEYKKPLTSDKLSINLFGNSEMRLEANADAAFVLNPKLSAMLFAHYSNDSQEHDGNNDGFMDMPKTQQVNLFNRWYYRTDRFISQLGVRFLSENRKSGQISNLNTSGELYRIGIRTNRFEAFAKEGLILDPQKNASFGLILSASYHNQDAFYGKTAYDAAQSNFYANLIYQTEFTPVHHFKAGASLNADIFREELTEGLNLSNSFNNNYDKNEIVPGIFGEYTLYLAKKLVVMAGVRGDFHSKEGFFVTPRIHLKYDPFEFLYFRGSAGKGYRTTHTLAENNYLLASNRKILISNDLKMENAWNYGISATAYIPVTTEKNITVIGEWYRTNFINQVVIDLDSDAHEVKFHNSNGTSYSNNYQLEATYEFFNGFTATAAYRITDVKMTIDGKLREKPLTGRYKGLLTMGYQTPLKKWQFDFTAQLNGGGRMPDPDPVNPLWEKEFDAYTVFSAQITKYFRTWSVYLGSENLFDFTQENPIIAANDPWSRNFDSSMIWGPVLGRKVYIGLRWNL